MNYTYKVSSFFFLLIALSFVVVSCSDDLIESDSTTQEDLISHKDSKDNLKQCSSCPVPTTTYAGGGGPGGSENDDDATSKDVGYLLMFVNNALYECEEQLNYRGVFETVEECDCQKQQFLSELPSDIGPCAFLLHDCMWDNYLLVNAECQQ